MTGPSSLASVPHRDIEALQIELREAQNAQQTAEIALAHEREANVIEGVRVAINDAIRSQLEACSERDRVKQDCKQAQDLLEKAQRAIRNLEYELARLFLENQLLERKNEELAAIKPPIRYSPLADDIARCCRRHYHIPATRHRMRAPDAESLRVTTPHPTLSNPFAHPAGLANEPLPPPVYDRTPSTSWVYRPPPETMEHPAVV